MADFWLIFPLVVILVGLVALIWPAMIVIRRIKNPRGLYLVVRIDGRGMYSPVQTFHSMENANLLRRHLETEEHLKTTSSYFNMYEIWRLS